MIEIKPTTEVLFPFMCKTMFPMEYQLYTYEQLIELISSTVITYDTGLEIISIDDIKFNIRVPYKNCDNGEVSNWEYTFNYDDSDIVSEIEVDIWLNENQFNIEKIPIVL